MYCPRLDHFRRVNSTGNISLCGHMTGAAQFNNLQELESSKWLKDVRESFQKDIWPPECRRCKITEETTGSSIRLNSLDNHNKLKIIHDQYLIIGGVLDNLCNSACQFCNSSLSTKIGSLHNKKSYVIQNNTLSFNRLPQERIIQLDINGGEPSYSKNYQQLLLNLPPNLKFLRVNTNGTRIMPNLENILESGISVTITLSFDGVEKIHEYVRWPISWGKFHSVVKKYLDLRSKYPSLNLNFWTTVNALNVYDLERIIDYSNQTDIEWSYGFLEKPTPLNVYFENTFTTQAKNLLKNAKYDIIHDMLNYVAIGENNQNEIDDYINQQDQLRNISYKDFLTHKG